MKRPSHSWSVTPAEARAIQERLKPRVEAADRLPEVRLVAGVDAHYDASGRATFAAVAVMRLPGLELEDRATARRSTTFPYVPGLLSFREAPAILDALERLGAAPDLLLVDGQGLAHPRRFGIACHVGVLADLPAIGVAKSRLVGAHEEPGKERGDRAPLRHRGEVVGVVVRTRANTRPLYVSIGHRISLETAVDYVLRCSLRFRLPEPIREADRLSRRHG